MSGKTDRFYPDDVQLNTVQEPFFGYSQEDFNNLNLLVPVQAQAGYAIDQGGVMPHECRPIYVPGIVGQARTVEVSGSSMEPVLWPGDWVVCTPVRNVNAIQEGAVHVVVSANNGIIIKYLRREPGVLLCVSEDERKYPPVAIPEAEVSELWQARLVITAAPLGHNSALLRLARIEAFISQQFPQFTQGKDSV